MIDRFIPLFAIGLLSGCAAAEGQYLGEYAEEHTKVSGDTTTLSKSHSIDTVADLFTSTDGTLVVYIDTLALFSCPVPMTGSVLSGFELESEVSCENDQAFVDQDSGSGRIFSETKIEQASATLSDASLTFRWSGSETFDFGTRTVFSVEGSFFGDR